jgi:hypothetical protein
VKVLLVPFQIFWHVSHDLLQTNLQQISIFLYQFDAIVPKDFELIQFILFDKVVHILDHVRKVLLDYLLLQISHGVFWGFEDFIESSFSLDGLVNSIENVLIFGNLLREGDEVELTSLQKLQIAVGVNAQKGNDLQLILKLNNLIRIVGCSKSMRDIEQLIRNLLSEMTIDDFFTQYLICFFLNSLGIVLGVNCKIVIE